eukprot:INCI7033.2.p1 GENE.INCI7033.2~~INCI7033.2.p1  ORF type:complete len:1400 (+),score=439.49 INCI7033.2:204-4202(+)
MADPAAGLSLEELQEKYRLLVQKHADVSAKAKGRLVELSSALKGTREEKGALESQLQAAAAKLAQFKTLTVKKVQGLQQKITELEQRNKEPEAASAAATTTTTAAAAAAAETAGLSKNAEEQEAPLAVVAELSGQISELQAALAAKTEEAERYAASDKKMRDTLSVLRAKTKEKVERMKEAHAQELAEAKQRYETELDEKAKALELKHTESVAAAVQSVRREAEERFAERLKNAESEVQSMQLQLDAVQQDQTVRERELVAEAQSSEANFVEKATTALKQEHLESVAALTQKLEAQMERAHAESSLEQQALRQEQENAVAQMKASEAGHAEELREHAAKNEAQAAEWAAKESSLIAEQAAVEQQSQARLGELVETVESQQEATQTFMAQATARYKAEQEAANDAAAALSEKLAAAQQQLNQRLQSTAELEQELKSARAALQTVENVAEQSQLDLESKVLAIDDNHNELHALRERERVATAEAARSEKEVCVLRQELSEAQAAEREKLNVAETNQQDLGAEVALLRVEVQSEREKNVSATEQAEEVLRRQLLAEHAAAVGLLETQAEEQRDLAVNAAMRDCSAKADTTLREELDAQHAEAQREEQEALQKQEQTFRDELCAAEEQLAQRSEQLEQTVLAQTRSEKAHTEQLDAMRKLIASQAAAEEEGSLKAKYKKLKSTHKQTITNALSKVQSLEEALQLQKELCTNSNESLLEARAQKEALEEEISELKDAVQVARAAAERSRKMAEAHQVQADGADEELSSLRNKLQTVTDELSHVQQRNQEQQAQLAKQSRPSTPPSETIDAAVAAAKRESDERNAALQTELQQSRSQVKQLEEDLAQVSAEVQTERSNSLANAQQLNECKMKSEERESVAKKQLRELARENADLQSRVGALQEELLVVGKVGLDEVIRNQQLEADKRLAAREAELEERHRVRVEMLETGAAQLRKAAAFDKDALARSEARAADLQRELSSAREAIEKHQAKIGDIVDVSNEQTATLRSQLAEQRQLNSDAKRKAKAYVESLLEENQGLQRELGEQRQHAANVQQRLDEMLQRETQLRDELANASATTATMTAEISKLQQVVESFKSEGAVTRDQTAAQLAQTARELEDHRRKRLHARDQLMTVAKNIEGDQGKLRALQQNTRSFLLPNMGHDISKLRGTLQQLAKVLWALVDFAGVDPSKYPNAPRPLEQKGNSNTRRSPVVTGGAVIDSDSGSDSGEPNSMISGVQNASGGGAHKEKEQAVKYNLGLDTVLWETLSAQAAEESRLVEEASVLSDTLSRLVLESGMGRNGGCVVALRAMVRGLAQVCPCACFCAPRYARAPSMSDSDV